MINNFQVYLNEQENFRPSKYKNYVLKNGVLFIGNKKFSWHYFTNFNQGSADAKFTIDTYVDGVVFQFIQGTPVISVPVETEEESGNVIIEDALDFSFTEEYEKLGKFIDLNKKYSLKEIL